jgi:hypothetical protein
MSYENVVEEFNKKGCKLLVTKKEYNVIVSINHIYTYIDMIKHNRYYKK